MNSSNVGVQAQLKKEAPLAVYTHCSGHCLNLVIVACSLPFIRHMIDKRKDTCLFFNMSPNGEGLLKSSYQH